MNDIDCYCVENHAQDSRCGFAKDNIVPTLHQKMGTGGNNVPLVLIEKKQENRPSDKISPVCLTPWDAQGNQAWDAVGDTVFTTVRGCGGASYQQSYILCRHMEKKDASIPR